MPNKRELNYVANKIIEVLREKFPNDGAYVQEKITRLEQMDNKYETFSWALNQLDHENLFQLFEKLDLDKRGYQYYNHLFKSL